MKEKEYPKLEKVYGAGYCQLMTMENKLVILGKNQEKIYNLLKEIDKKLGGGEDCNLVIRHK